MDSINCKITEITNILMGFGMTIQNRVPGKVITSPARYTKLVSCAEKLVEEKIASGEELDLIVPPCGSREYRLGIRV